MYSNQAIRSANLLPNALENAKFCPKKPSGCFNLDYTSHVEDALSNLESVSPPDELRSLHGKYVAAVRDLVQAGKSIEQFFDEGNRTYFDTAQSLLKSAQKKIDEARDLESQIK